MGRNAYEKVSQREYARRLGISNEAVSKAVREGRIKKGWNKKENKIIVEYADKEFGGLFKNTDSESESANRADVKGVSVKMSDGLGGEIKNPNDKLTLTAKSSYNEARRVQAILQAELTAKELAKITGELVNKDEVYKQLFSFGQYIRTSLLAIPDRTIDNIIASKSRGEAHNLLTAALHEVLEQLTKSEQLNFQSK